MAIAYQFNKISMQQLQIQLKTRLTAVPILKSKEAALRVTIQKQKEALKEFAKRLNKKIADSDRDIRLWNEFPEKLFRLNNVEIAIKKIAGIKIPQLNDFSCDVDKFSRFSSPVWLSLGVDRLKEITELLIQVEVAQKCVSILEYALKKTTQKVNLYEKVQIPEYSQAIIKIKRYLEDVDNLEKSAQKITKSKQAHEFSSGNQA